MQNRMIKNILEMLVVLLFTAALLYVPFLRVSGKVPVDDPGIGVYYSAACVTAEYVIPAQMTGLEKCYVQLLHAVLLLFGNSLFAAQFAQACLWGICCLIGYFAIRDLCGTEIALLLYAIFDCIAWLHRRIHFLSPIVLCVLGGISLFACLSGIGRAAYRRRHQVQNVEEKGEKGEKSMLEETVNQIPNVLPGPKKHVKRENVDYGFQVSEKLMHFDLEISDQDDFDLQ